MTADHLEQRVDPQNIVRIDRHADAGLERQGQLGRIDLRERMA